MTILEHTPRRAALAVKKTVRSARLMPSITITISQILIYNEISVTPGPRFKRFRAAARGRANKYQHKTSHIRVVVDGEVRVAKKPAAKVEKKRRPNNGPKSKSN
jgi:large subunit ribosomal protein L22